MLVTFQRLLLTFSPRLALPVTPASARQVFPWSQGCRKDSPDCGLITTEPSLLFLRICLLQNRCKCDDIDVTAKPGKAPSATPQPPPCAAAATAHHQPPSPRMQARPGQTQVRCCSWRCWTRGGATRRGRRTTRCWPGSLRACRRRTSRGWRACSTACSSSPPTSRTPRHVSLDEFRFN